MYISKENQKYINMVTKNLHEIWVSLKKPNTNLERKSMHRNFIATPYLLELMLYIKALFPSHLFKTTFMTKGLDYIYRTSKFLTVNFQQQQKQDKYIRPYKKFLVSRPGVHHFWRACQEKFCFLFHWIWYIWHYN